VRWPAASWAPEAPPTPALGRRSSPGWLAAGDVNGFLGLTLDNTTNLVILASLLIGVFGFPADLVLAWIGALDDALPYLSIALPFALVTIVGGIDNTESALASGDEYRARDILLVEALATVLTGSAAA